MHIHVHTVAERMSDGDSNVDAESETSDVECAYSEEDLQRIALARKLAYENRARRQLEAQQAAELTALLFGGGGALAELVPLPQESVSLSSCAKCRRPVSNPRVCSACLAACYCSIECHRSDMQHSRQCRLLVYVTEPRCL